MGPYFLALRTLTQKNLSFFLEHQDTLQELLEQEEPLHPLLGPGRPYESLDYTTLMNLVTHAANRPEDIEMRNTVIAVYLLRFLQHGRYFSPQVPEKRKGDRSLHRHELFILRVLHHLVAVAAYNGLPLRNVVVSHLADIGWERLGLSLHTSLALLNHSCDPNVFVVPGQDQRQLLLVAARHIQPGEELTLAYLPSYLHLELAQRDYQLVKNYNLECMCQACRERWPLRDHLPDALARIPNFDQEKFYAVRHGDKKDICDEINGARWMADFGLSTGSFEVAQEALDALSRSLERHVRKPHLYFVEVAEMVERLAISQYVGISIDDMGEEEEETAPAVATSMPVSQSAPQLSSLAAPRQANQAAAARSSNGTSNGHQVALHQNGCEDKGTEGPASHEGALKQIRLFEAPKESPGESGDRQSPPVLRPRSPTLRLVTSQDKSQNRKSVLERFEESRLNVFGEKQVRELRQEVVKAKRELADSMRLFPAKAVMAQRMATFQNKAQKVNIFYFFHFQEK